MLGGKSIVMITGLLALLNRNGGKLIGSAPLILTITASCTCPPFLLSSLTPGCTRSWDVFNTEDWLKGALHDSCVMRLSSMINWGLSGKQLFGVTHIPASKPCQLMGSPSWTWVEYFNLFSLPQNKLVRVSSVVILPHWDCQSANSHGDEAGS